MVRLTLPVSCALANRGSAAARAKPRVLMEVRFMFPPVGQVRDKGFKHGPCHRLFHPHTPRVARTHALCAIRCTSLAAAHLRGANPRRSRANKRAARTRLGSHPAMSLALVQSRALLGLQAPAVTVEVHLANGLPSFTLVGLADVEVKEARERVRSALQNAGLDFPNNKRITVNLAPADLPKDSGPVRPADCAGHPRRQWADRCQPTGGA